MSESEIDGHPTVSNDHLNVAITRKPHCQVKLDIQVDAQAVEAAYQKAVKMVNKEVNLPGFRKGKAPLKLVLEKFEPTIQREWIDTVLQTAFAEALKLTHLHPLNNDNIQRPLVHNCSREKGASFTIEFEARPTIPSINLEDVKINKANVNHPTDQERQNVLQNLLLRFATYEPIEDRPVQLDDFINVSVIMLENPPRTVIEDQRTQVNQTGLPIWLRQKTIGLRAGESAEGMTEQDPNLIDPDPTFQSVPFKITVHSIWKGTLPNVDDELAQRVGLNTSDALLKKIDSQLQQESEEEAHQEDVKAIEQILVQKYPFEIPQSYIDSNRDARVNDYLESIDDGSQEYSQEELQRVERAIEQSTIQQLQLFFLMSKIASDHNITVTQEDLSQELAQQVSLMSIRRNTIDLQDKEKFREQLYHAALDRKIKQFLIEKATS